MLATKIKICGIKDVETAKVASNCGADYIGLVFYEKSKRNIPSLDIAKEIVESIKNTETVPVAVFVDQDAESMLEILEKTSIKTVQLHGDQARHSHAELPNELVRIYAITVEANGSTIFKDVDLNPKRDFLLFDTKNPGSGQSFDHQKFHYDGEFNFFIAGGLSAETAILCIDTLHPYGLDFSSKLESSPGVKDPQLIKQLLQRLKHG